MPKSRAWGGLTAMVGPLSSCWVQSVVCLGLSWFLAGFCTRAQVCSSGTGLGWLTYVSLRDNTVAQKASTLNYSHSLEFYDHFDILHVDNCVVSFHHKVD